MLTFISGFNLDLLGVPSNVVQCQSDSELMQLLANKPMQQIIFRRSCTPLVWF